MTSASTSLPRPTRRSPGGTRACSYNHSGPAWAGGSPPTTRGMPAASIGRSIVTGASNSSPTTTAPRNYLLMVRPIHSAPCSTNSTALPVPDATTPRWRHKSADYTSRCPCLPSLGGTIRATSKDTGQSPHPWPAGSLPGRPRGSGSSPTRPPAELSTPTRRNTGRTPHSALLSEPETAPAGSPAATHPPPPAKSTSPHRRAAGDTPRRPINQPATTANNGETPGQHAYRADSKYRRTASTRR
ncbi:hypothetical protein BJY26_002782 [Spelaeicoccus albus]|uniref:Uncharacterized protein n=1 Tax=Spelaeicoccus albus TaxID=1280376 RepID=A0A7Z0D457_9MICO|nr:hypothetical protein [Spelaeicoccus albus]